MRQFVFLVLSAAFAVEFDDQWEIAPSPVKANLQKFKPEVNLMGDIVVLQKRGLLLSKKEYKEFDLAFEWKWLNDPPDETYPDHLCVVLATDGKQREDWSHEIQKGLVIRFIPNLGGSVSIVDENGIQEGVELIKKDQIGLERAKIHKIKITYAKEILTVEVNKEAIQIKRSNLKGKIAIYNRERVGGVIKESQLTKLRLE